MKRLKIIFFSTAVALMSSACSSEAPEKAPEEKTAYVERKITDTTTFSNDVRSYSDASGVAAVLDVPEMLVLSVMDSTASKNVSEAMVKNYALLEEDLMTTGAEMNGAMGMITYNNNVENFKFENILCINRMPAVQPKHSKIVILEASKMLIYNFYGPYQNLFAAYDRIKLYCKQNNLSQTGPMREFYITDPEKEQDKLKWLTRIMVPVTVIEKENK